MVTTAPAQTQVWINVYWNQQPTPQTVGPEPTNAQGQVSPSFKFTVRSQTNAYPVVVAVYMGNPPAGQADNCETHFTPAG